MHKRSSSGSAQAHLFRQPLCKSSDEEAIDEGDEDEWADEAEDARQEDEGEEEDVSSSSEDSVSDFNVGQATLDNAHNRQWYSRKTLQSRFFPFKALELGLMLAWDSTGKRISRRKMDSLLALISDPKFDAKKLIGFTAKKLRGLRKTAVGDNRVYQVHEDCHQKGPLLHVIYGSITLSAGGRCRRVNQHQSA